MGMMGMMAMVTMEQSEAVVIGSILMDFDVVGCMKALEKERRYPQRAIEDSIRLMNTKSC